MTTEKNALEKAWANHSRLWENNLWTYPVISRRAGGLSIGINLNPDKSCSFRCAYCQVEKTTAKKNIKLDLSILESEIVSMILEYERSGLSSFEKFREVPEENRKIKDISLSGDGEPTLSPEFSKVCALLREIQKRFSHHDFRLTLITNATHLQEENVLRGLSFLTEANGEIWGKLDAGTERWYKKINRSKIPLEKIQENLEAIAERFPLKIQTMICRIEEETIDDEELSAYISRLKKIERRGSIREVQLYGIARAVAQIKTQALPRSFLEEVAERLRSEITAKVSVF